MTPPKSFILIILFCLSFISCSKSEYIYIPVKCSITPPERPTKTKDFIKDFEAVIIYSLMLERALKICTKD